MVSKTEENLKSFPLPDDQLRGAAVLATSVADCELVADELKSLLVASRKAFLELWTITKAMGDLLIELTEERGKRAWLDARLRKAERESKRLALPLWFWRRDPAVDLDNAVVHRIRFLLEEQFGPDDLWTCLRDFLEHVEAEMSDARLQQLILWAKGVRQ